MKPKPQWIPYRDDPTRDRTGISFDRRPQDDIVAPAGQFRVCAYHIDFDEAPTVYVDVATLEEAKRITDTLHVSRGKWNVDYATTYDDKGNIVHHNRPW